MMAETIDVEKVEGRRLGVVSIILKDRDESYVPETVPNSSKVSESVLARRRLPLGHHALRWKIRNLKKV